MILLTNQEKKYKNYIDKHRQYVKFAYSRFINHINIYDKIPYPINFDNLYARIQTHDLSKYEPEEFYPYRQYYYPEDDAFISTEILNNGWIHHYSYNDHHPEFWIIDRDINTNAICNEQFYKLKSRDMSIEAILEMFADWLAMSLTHHSSLKIWYSQEGYKLPFSINTRKIVEFILDILYEQDNLDVLLTSLYVPKKKV